MITQNERPPAKYTPQLAALQEIEKRYRYHPPAGDQAKRYETIRADVLALAHVLYAYCPPSRELSTALTQLDAVMFNANAAIARNEGQASTAGTRSG